MSNQYTLLEDNNVINIQIPDSNNTNLGNSNNNEFNNNLHAGSYYTSDFKVTDHAGNHYNPVLYDYSTLNFSPYVGNQIDQFRGANDSADIDPDMDEFSRNEILRERNKYKVDSTIKVYFGNVLLVLVIDVLFITFIYYIVNVMKKLKPTSKQEQDPGLILLCLIITYFMKICLVMYKSTVTQLLHNMKTDKNACKFIDQMRQSKPYPRYGIECYHYSRSKKRSSKTVTLSKYKEFNYRYWNDYSPEIYKALDKYKITCINLSKKLVFYNDKTKEQYNNNIDVFTEEYKHKDQHYNTLKNLHLEGFEHFTLSFRKNSDIPWYYNIFWWTFANMLFLTSIYYIFFWKQIATIDYTLIKVISIDERIQMTDEKNQADSDKVMTTESDLFVDDMGEGVDCNIK